VDDGGSSGRSTWSDNRTTLLNSSSSTVSRSSSNCATLRTLFSPASIIQGVERGVSNQIKSNLFATSSVHNITVSSHCVWLDRQAINSHLCLPMTTKPKNKNTIKTNNNIYTVDIVKHFRQILSKLAESSASYKKHSNVIWQFRPKNRSFKCS